MKRDDMAKPVAMLPNGHPVWEDDPALNLTWREMAQIATGTVFVLAMFVAVAFVFALGAS